MAWYSIFTNTYHTVTDTLKNKIESVLFHVLQGIMSGIENVTKEIISGIFNASTSLIIGTVNDSARLGIFALPAMIIGLTAVFSIALIIIRGIGELV